MAGKRKRAPSAAQMRARAAFAARFGGRRIRGSSRGAASFAPRTVHRRAHSFASSLKDKFDWLEALLFGVFGYMLAPTLSSLGIGEILMKNKFYAGVINAGWNATAGTKGQAAWGFGGLTALGKLGGVGLLGKQIYDVSQGKALSKGDVSALIPMSLGLILDPPSWGEGEGGGGGADW